MGAYNGDIWFFGCECCCVHHQIHKLQIAADRKDGNDTVVRIFNKNSLRTLHKLSRTSNQLYTQTCIDFSWGIHKHKAANACTAVNYTEGVCMDQLLQWQDCVYGTTTGSVVHIANRMSSPISEIESRANSFKNKLGIVLCIIVCLMWKSSCPIDADFIIIIQRELLLKSACW